MFVNVAHKSFGENYIGSIQQMVLDIAISAKTSFFGPEKANAKTAADSILKMRVGRAGGPGGRQGVASYVVAITQEEQMTGFPVEPPKSPVDLETSTWNHVICFLEP
jgi:hypothetical protein